MIENSINKQRIGSAVPERQKNTKYKSLSGKSLEKYSMETSARLTKVSTI